ncbi:MAG: hypothetical protein QMD11_04410 [Smithella sp.]|nr:hypothetical protein [Smithella sp.]
MFSGKEKTKSMIDEIRLSSELLRINSGYERSEVFLKLFLIGTFLLLLFFHQDIISVLKVKSIDEQLTLIAIPVFFLSSVVFAIYQMNRRRGKTFIATEKGFFIEPLLADFWKDISEYKWNAATDVYRDLFSGKKQELSLLLYNNKGNLPKIHDLVMYGIFFTADQVPYMDGIFSRLGIKKLEE